MRRPCFSFALLMWAGVLLAWVCSATAYTCEGTGGEPEVMKLRIPGTTVDFELAQTPAGVVTFENEPREVGAMLALRTEVTWDLYDVFVYELDRPDGSSEADAVSRPSKPYVPPDRGFGHDGYPAIGMTRHGAERFCAWLSLKLGVTVRLPAQHEWIYLARGGETGAYCCGSSDETLAEIAWYAGNSEHTTHPVGQKTPNAFGLYDVHGNAAEWVITDTRRPYAMGGGYRDAAGECAATSAQRQASRWNQSDPQIPKSRWWLADCSWVGFRFVIDANEENINLLRELEETQRGE